VLDRVNVDTDQIIPKQFLKTIKRTGLREGLFFDWRKKKDGSTNPEFFLNQPRYQGATILLTRDNFGCGSSREHAPWALLDQGFRCVIAPSFGPIFYNNCFQNGVLPVVVPAKVVEDLAAEVEATQGEGKVLVDLTRCVVGAPGGTETPFMVDALLREGMLKGLDQIELTRAREPQIQAFQDRDRERRPWLYPSP